MDLAQRSGLLHVNIGMESINAGTLEGMNKRFNRLPNMAKCWPASAAAASAIP